MPNTTFYDKNWLHLFIRTSRVAKMSLLLNTGAILMRNELTAQTMPCACYLVKLELFGLLMSYAKRNFLQQKQIVPVYMNKQGCQDCTFCWPWVQYWWWTNQQHKPWLVLNTWWSQNSLAYLHLMPNTTFCNRNWLHLFKYISRAAKTVPSVDHGHSLFVLQGSAAYMVTELSVPVSCWRAACVEQDAKALATENKTIKSV